MLKKLNLDSMKGLIVALGVLSLTTTSCTKSDESLQPNQSEIESRRRPSGGSGVSTSVPQVTGLSATVTGSNSVYLTWNSVPGGTSYWVRRNGELLAIWTDTYFTDGTVSPGTSYTYTVAAVVNSTLGPNSASVTVTP